MNREGWEEPSAKSAVAVARQRGSLDQWRSACMAAGLGRGPITRSARESSSPRPPRTNWPASAHDRAVPGFDKIRCEEGKRKSALSGHSLRSDLSPLLSGLCCKTPKMAFSDFSAKRATKRQSPINVSSSALPKLPVSSSLVAVVPRTIVRSPRSQPGKFVFSGPKRVLQHYPPSNGHRNADQM
jgi:hypothetical protein